MRLLFLLALLLSACSHVVERPASIDLGPCPTNRGPSLGGDGGAVVVLTSGGQPAFTMVCSEEQGVWRWRREPGGCR